MNNTMNNNNCASPIPDDMHLSYDRKGEDLFSFFIDRPLVTTILFIIESVILIGGLLVRHLYGESPSLVVLFWLNCVFFILKVFPSMIIVIEHKINPKAKEQEELSRDYERKIIVPIKVLLYHMDIPVNRELLVEAYGEFRVLGVLHTSYDIDKKYSYYFGRYGLDRMDITRKVFSAQEYDQFKETVMRWTKGNPVIVHEYVMGRDLYSPYAQLKWSVDSCTSEVISEWEEARRKPDYKPWQYQLSTITKKTKKTKK